MSKLQFRYVGSYLRVFCAHVIKGEKQLVYGQRWRVCFPARDDDICRIACRQLIASNTLK